MIPHDPTGASVFQRVLGSAFAQLAPAVQRGHQPGAALLLSGQASVRRGSSWLARLLCGLIGFPVEGDAIPVTVHMQTQDGGECWQRRFGAQRFESRFRAGQGAQRGLLVEQFGLLRFHIALAVVDGALHWTVRSGCRVSANSRVFSPNSRLVQSHICFEYAHSGCTDQQYWTLLTNSSGGLDKGPRKALLVRVLREAKCWRSDFCKSGA